MNTKNLCNASHGSEKLSSLYLGNKLLWSKSSEYCNIPQSEDLVSLYTLGGFRLETTSGLSTGLWTDAVTKKTIVWSNVYITSTYSANSNGVKLTSGTYEIPIECPDHKGSIYARFRISEFIVGTVFAFFKNDTGGFEFAYDNGVLTVRRYLTKNFFESIDVAINPHEYHTYAFINDGKAVKLYIDGVFLTETACQEFPGSITFTSDYQKDLCVAMETFAVYKNIHTPDEVAEISGCINIKVPNKLKPESQRIWLYDHGNQFEAFTGGWEVYKPSGYSEAIASLDENCIMLNGVNRSNYKVTTRAKTVNRVNFTPYTWLYFRISSSCFSSEVQYTCDVPGVKCGYTTSSISSSSGFAYTSNTVANIGGKTGQTEDDSVIVGVDITALSGNYAPYIADGSGRTDGSCSRIYEVWME